MQAAKRSTARNYLETCVHGRQECSGRQMRNGFLMLNLVVWAIILAGIKLLA